MRTTIDWLRDFTDIPADGRALVEALTAEDCKVKIEETPADSIAGVLSGKVVSIARHPSAVHLTVCRVDVGTGSLLQIVSEASIVSAGDCVITALAGATLPGGVVRQQVVHGVHSEGRLCSIQDLGYSRAEFPDAPATGVYILLPDAPIGVDIRGLLGLDDLILEFEMDPERPDCLSVEGAGREVARILGNEFRPVEPVVVAKSDQASSDYHAQLSEESEILYSSCARVVTDVRLEPSPAWMQQRLRAAGINPVTSYVDISNYVTLELGQPIRLVDIRAISGSEVHVLREDTTIIVALSHSDDQRVLDRACELIEQLDCGRVTRGTLRAEGDLPGS